MKKYCLLLFLSFKLFSMKTLEVGRQKPTKEQPETVTESAETSPKTIAKLQELCADVLKKNIEEETVWGVFQQAYACKNQKLMKSALDFVADNIDALKYLDDSYIFERGQEWKNIINRLAPVVQLKFYGQDHNFDRLEKFLFSNLSQNNSNLRFRLISWFMSDQAISKLFADEKFILGAKLIAFENNPKRIAAIAEELTKKFSKVLVFHNISPKLLAALAESYSPKFYVLDHQLGEMFLKDRQASFFIDLLGISLSDATTPQIIFLKKLLVMQRQDPQEVMIKGIDFVDTIIKEFNDLKIQNKQISKSCSFAQNNVKCTEIDKKITDWLNGKHIFWNNYRKNIWS